MTPAPRTEGRRSRAGPRPVSRVLLAEAEVLSFRRGLAFDAALERVAQAVARLPLPARRRVVRALLLEALRRRLVVRRPSATVH